MESTTSFTPIRKRLFTSGSSSLRKTVKKPKMDSQTVAKIAKKVVMKAAETKSSLTNYGINPLDGIWNAVNLSFPIGQGDTAEDVIGEKIFLKSINLRISVFTQNNNAGTTSIGRVVVFRSKSQICTSSTAVLTTSTTELTRSPVNTSAPHTAHIDLHKVDLLFDQSFTLTPQVANTQTIQHTMNAVIPIGKTHYFDSDNSGLFKDKQYYLGVVGYNGILVSSPLGFTASCAMNFKDL